MRCDKYIVKQDQGLVVGELFRKDNSIIQEVRHRFGNDISNVVVMCKFIGRGIKEPSEDNHGKPFRGIAKCQQGDKFSEATGKKIVDMKTAYKYHIAMSKKYRQIEKRLLETFEKISRLKDEHLEKAGNLDEMLGKYL